MTTKFKQPGDNLDWTNGTGSDVSSGQIIELGDSIAVALNDIPDTETGAVGVEGVYSVAKKSGTAWNAGDKLDWDKSASEFHKGITPATGDITGCAIAAADAASGDTTATVKLTNPGTVN
jgi:predicted RecA/RadA family phage recombinase